ncbi:3747_t:CDS:1, partial [Scutellospora calospora]
MKTKFKNETTKSYFRRQLQRQKDKQFYETPKSYFQRQESLFRVETPKSYFQRQLQRQKDKQFYDSILKKTLYSPEDIFRVETPNTFDARQYIYSRKRKSRCVPNSSNFLEAVQLVEEVHIKKENDKWDDILQMADEWTNRLLPDFLIDKRDEITDEWANRLSHNFLSDYEIDDSLYKHDTSDNY